MKFKKGDKVLVRATAHTKDRPYVLESPRVKIIRGVEKPAWHGTTKDGGIPRPFVTVSYPDPFYGIVVGWSTRVSGLYFPGSSYEDPGYIMDEMTHIVVMVEKTDSQRWSPPVACREEDIEAMEV